MGRVKNHFHDEIQRNATDCGPCPPRKGMKLVILESPYAGDVARNVEYAKRCALDCLNRGESPMVSHLLYTQILDDTKPDERKLGIAAGLAWRGVADYSVFYIDYGMTPGMEAAFADVDYVAEHRTIGKNPTPAVTYYSKGNPNYCPHGIVWENDCPDCRADQF